MNVLSIGAGYVGGATSVVMAQNCPEHEFVVADIDCERIRQWNTGKAPFFEPGLDDLIWCDNLSFTADVPAAIAKADIIFISVNTPTKDRGIGEGKACDTSRVEAVARSIAEHVTKDVIVVEKTTVPVGTCNNLREIFMECGHYVEVLSNPEFLAEGTAINDLISPDRVLIGSAKTAKGQRAAMVLARLYYHWVPEHKILLTDKWSSELTKLVANAFLAQRVSSINSIAEICEYVGANVDEVARAIGADQRIGPKFLKASLGFGGSCFRKDILSLVYIAESLGLEEVAAYWQQVITMNEHQQDRLVDKMFGNMFGSLAGKRVAVLGFAFKANTGDTRDTPAIRLCEHLYNEGARVRVTDPRALANAREDMGDMADYFEDPYVAASQCHAVVVATDWPQYRDLHWGQIFNRMEQPAFIFDGRNLLDHSRLENIGFQVFATGK